MLPPPHPPPLPPPDLLQASASKHVSQQKPSPQLNVTATGPPNSVSLSLLVYNGWPFANHWEYFIALEVKRGWDISLTGRKPDRVVRLGWIQMNLVEPLDAVFRVGEDPVVEVEPRSEMENMLFNVPAPEKTLRDAVDDQVSQFHSLCGLKTNSLQIDRRTRIMQRNCQTWIVETSELLVKEGLLEQEVVDYLVANKQY
ncbi:uncharacterized protein QC763_0077800 [Podospora pseudopauciseta]|uniref:Uncharacterized protein n=1 Tax=Podospora pseudopauciseta TaxID=2093780 RepID=A0ABR0HB60_9PEZI|nr:hypothetical protein QC763_0077800 [Podospora pseudopauciseta]